MDNNAYWNNGDALPPADGETVSIADDANPVIGDPRLPAVGTVVKPVWSSVSSEFADGSETTCDVHTRLVETYGMPAAGSSLIGAARPDQSPDHDILGRPRTAPDIGAVERP